MNIILGQSFSTRSVIPQLVIVTPTRFLDFNTRTYKEKKFKVTYECIFLVFFCLFLSFITLTGTTEKQLMPIFLFRIKKKNYADRSFSFFVQLKKWASLKDKGFFFTCTWSSSITGSLVLVDLSAVRFRFMA
jgi:hypothetical protein